jgi:hypothetical protein
MLDELRSLAAATRGGSQGRRLSQCEPLATFFFRIPRKARPGFTDNE